MRIPAWLIPTVLIIFFLTYYLISLSEPTQPVYLEQPVVEAKLSEVQALITEINNKNKQIHTFTCSDIDIKISKLRIITIRGELYFDKPRFFRMRTSSILGPETDIGSNENYFWFWSKRMDPPALHYSHYDNIHNTRLKTPFHPIWIMSTLGLSEINSQNGVAFKRGKYWEIREQTRSAVGVPVTKATLIDAEKKAIVGHYIYEKGELVASTEVLEHVNHNGFLVPYHMVIIWHESGSVMQWTLNNPTINMPIDKNQWIMPNMRDKIDMGMPSLAESFTNGISS